MTKLELQETSVAALIATYRRAIPDLDVSEENQPNTEDKTFTTDQILST